MNREKSFALIALQFPPIGGGSSERMSGFVKYWCQTPGVSIHVVSSVVEGAESPIDRFLVEDVADVRSLVRLTTLPSMFNKRWIKNVRILRLLSRFFLRLIPIDSHLLWALRSAWVVSKLFNEGKITTVLTTSTPYSVHVAGLLLKMIHPRIKWVADFRDPWTTNYQKRIKKHLPFEVFFNRKVEQRVYSVADKIVLNTHQNFLDLQPIFDLDSSKVKVIQNGYDDGIDFLVSAAEEKKESEFRIGYIGGFRGDWFEGPVYDALFLLKARAPDVYKKLDICIVGQDELQKEGAVSRLGVSEVFSCKGFHPRRMLGGWIASFDALLLILPPNSGEPLGWVPQKLYFYLSTGLPVFCIAPEGEAAKYVRDTCSGIVIDPAQIDEIATKLTEWVESSPEAKDYYRDEVSMYSKKVLATEFIDFMFEN